jgi:transposase
MLGPSDTPDHIAALSVEEENQALKARVANLEQQLRHQKFVEQKLESKIEDLLRRMFGPKSEKLDPNQRELLFAQIEADHCLKAEAPPQPAPHKADSQPKKRRGGGRRPAPEHLPIERVEIDLPEEQKVGLVRIREQITEELDYRPSQFFRRHYVRFVYAHPHSEHAPVMAPLPPRVLAQSGVGPGLLSHLLVSKYVDHCPLNRFEQVAARVDVDLPRQKQCRWVEEGALLLRTVYDQFIERILASGYVQADETNVKVLDPDRGGHAAQAYLWTYLSPHQRTIVFDFDLSRGRGNLQRFFPQDWSGVVQSDGYEVYDRFLAHKPITHVGCMAHLRRYVVEALEEGGELLAALMLDIGALYEIETQAREQKLDFQARAQLRQERSVPVLERLHQNFELARQQALPQSRLGRAATYALNQWTKLVRYADADMGHVLIDNNSVERGIRPTKLGSKNWMFIGHPDAGWRSAVIYSIVGTCKLLKVNPQHYLEWVLPKLAAATANDTSGLLPHDFAVINSS